MPNTKLTTRSTRREVLANAATTVTERTSGLDTSKDQATGYGNSLRVTDLNVGQLLEQQLTELRLIRMHLEMVTGEEIKPQDITL